MHQLSTLLTVTEKCQVQITGLLRSAGVPLVMGLHDPGHYTWSVMRMAWWSLVTWSQFCSALQSAVVVRGQLQCKVSTVSVQTRLKNVVSVSGVPGSRQSTGKTQLSPLPHCRAAAYQWPLTLQHGPCQHQPVITHVITQHKLCQPPTLH